MKVRKCVLHAGVIILSSLPLQVGQGYAQTTYYEYVNAFIGADGPGNVFIGPSCPFGMVKPGPDCSKAANAGSSCTALLVAT